VLVLTIDYFRYGVIVLYPRGRKYLYGSTEQIHTGGVLMLMLTIPERYDEIDIQIGKAMAAVEADTGASPVLYAVVKEFRRKSLKALNALKGADNQAVIEHIVEVEQAADSAKYAAEADEGLSEGTRKAILDAHTSACILKGWLPSLTD
jgi:hypothetical protein